MEINTQRLAGSLLSIAFIVIVIGSYVIVAQEAVTGTWKANTDTGKHAKQGEIYLHFERQSAKGDRGLAPSGSARRAARRWRASPAVSSAAMQVHCARAAHARSAAAGWAVHRDGRGSAGAQGGVSGGDCVPHGLHRRRTIGPTGRTPPEEWLRSVSLADPRESHRA